jgi:hypothetical protein
MKSSDFSSPLSIVTSICFSTPASIVSRFGLIEIFTAGAEAVGFGGGAVLESMYAWQT